MATTATDTTGTTQSNQATALFTAATQNAKNEGGDLYVCDKGIQTTRHPHPIMTAESQTKATNHNRSPAPAPKHGRGPPPDTSPSSANAARALSSLFHHRPPAYHPHHSPYATAPHSPYAAPRSPYAAAPAWGGPPPPRYAYQQQQRPDEQYSSWQQRPYSSVTHGPSFPKQSSNSPTASSASLESSQSSYAPYPSPREPRARRPPPPPYYSEPSYNKMYPRYCYSGDGTSPNSQPKRLAEDERYLVTPTPKKMRLDPCPVPEEYSRKTKSLGLLCENFCKQDWSNGIGIDEAAKVLGVERRRIYDIINILESLEIVQRQCKNRYHWLGFGQLPNVMAEIQQEGICRDGLAEEARHLGVLGRDEKVIDAPEVGQTKKSLGRLSRQYLQLFLIGHEVMSLTEASDRIMGKAEEPAGIADPTARKAALSKGQKTKIRRLYDIANVLASIGLVEKTDGERRTRPTFTWIYHWSPWQIRELMTRGGSVQSTPRIEQRAAAALTELSPRVQSTPPVEQRAAAVKVELSPRDSNKDVLAHIHEHGAREPASQKRPPVPETPTRVESATLTHN